MSSKFLIINLLIGPLLLFLGLLVKAFPPKKINWIYGYRTSRSMKSQEAWDASNKYATEKMIWIAIITTAVQVIFYFVFSPQTALLMACTVMCVLLLGVFIVVENYLKTNFDTQDKPKH